MNLRARGQHCGIALRVTGSGAVAVTESYSGMPVRHAAANRNTARPRGVSFAARHSPIYRPIPAHRGVRHNPYGSVMVMDAPTAQGPTESARVRVRAFVERAGMRTVAFLLSRIALRQTCSRMLRARGKSAQVLTRCSSSDPRRATRAMVLPRESLRLAFRSAPVGVGSDRIGRWPVRVDHHLRHPGRSSHS